MHLMLQVFFIIVSSLLCLALGICVWLFAERRALRRDRIRLEQTLSSTEQASSKHLARSNELQTKLEVEQATKQQMEKHFQQMQSRTKETFKSVASDVLKESNNQFLQLAQKSFEKEQKEVTVQLETRKQAIESMIKPVRESLDKYNTSLREIEKSRQKAYSELNEQVKSMIQNESRLREETANLVKALRRPEVRGRWGEMQLERVAELAGMIEHCDFSKQVSVRDNAGDLLQPDMVIHLPSDRNIVVDAKTPIEAFITATETTDEQQRQVYLKQFADHVETQVKLLSAKRYNDQFERSPDFVVLFIPGEGFLQPAVGLKPRLIEQAMEKGVVIATPSTLVALLKTVALGWREQQVAQNAKRISQLGQELHERIAVATGHVERLGGNLEKAVKSYNQFVGSFETRVVNSARKFKELGADSSKELPQEILQIEVIPREVTVKSEE